MSRRAQWHSSYVDGSILNVQASLLLFVYFASFHFGLPFLISSFFTTCVMDVKFLCEESSARVFSWRRLRPAGKGKKGLENWCVFFLKKCALWCRSKSSRSAATGAVVKRSGVSRNAGGCDGWLAGWLAGWMVEKRWTMDYANTRIVAECIHLIWTT